mmetsp:Transcript_85988/g.242892  ORF Transcript_85988/g.242892 Transcript_85988/m.242892 type:complete len:304 (+) Transcript_85988:505-1416(+)
MVCVVAWLIIAVWNYLTAGYTSSNLWVAAIFFVVSVFGWFHANSMHTQEALHEQVGLLKKVNITLDETHANLSDDAKNLEETMKEMDEQIEQYRGENVKNETMTIMEVFRHLSGTPEEADRKGETLHVIQTYKYAMQEIHELTEEKKKERKDNTTIEANIETDDEGGWKYTMKAHDADKHVIGETSVTLHFERAETADTENPNGGHVMKVIPMVNGKKVEGKIPPGCVKMRDIEDLFRGELEGVSYTGKDEYRENRLPDGIKSVKDCFASEDDQIEFWRELHREVDIDLNEYVSQMQKMSSTM